ATLLTGFDWRRACPAKPWPLVHRTGASVAVPRHRCPPHCMEEESRHDASDVHVSARCARDKVCNQSSLATVFTVESLKLPHYSLPFLFLKTWFSCERRLFPPLASMLFKRLLLAIEPVERSSSSVTSGPRSSNSPQSLEPIKTASPVTIP